MYLVALFLATSNGPLIYQRIWRDLVPDGEPYVFEVNVADIILKAAPGDPRLTRLTVTHSGGRFDLDLRAGWLLFPDSTPTIVDNRPWYAALLDRWRLKDR